MRFNNKKLKIGRKKKECVLSSLDFFGCKVYDYIIREVSFKKQERKMSSIDLKLNWAFTSVSDIFIEEYMTRPNYPVYSLVYIYALKKAARGEELTNKSVAEKFELMESEVAKIWQYWEENGLMKQHDDNSIEFIMPKTRETQAEKPAAQPQKTEDMPTVFTLEKKPSYTPEDIKKLSEKDEQIPMLLGAAEKLLNKPLSANGANTIVGFYDWLGLPVEVIYVLLSYCGKHRKSMRYMETTAMDWSKKSINTVDAAEDYLNIFLNEYKKIMRAYGVNDRSPSEEEQEYMSSWVKRLKMPMALIKEACVRTVNNTGKVSFAYTNSILINWHDMNVTTLDGVRELDEEHKKNTAPKPKSKPQKQKTGDYEQRSYDENTLEDIFDRKAGE